MRVSTSFSANVDAAIGQFQVGLPVRNQEQFKIRYQRLPFLQSLTETMYRPMVKGVGQSLERPWSARSEVTNRRSHTSYESEGYTRPCRLGLSQDYATI